MPLKDGIGKHFHSNSNKNRNYRQAPKYQSDRRIQGNTKPTKIKVNQRKGWRTGNHGKTKKHESRSPHAQKKAF